MKGGDALSEKFVVPPSGGLACCDNYLILHKPPEGGTTNFLSFNHKKGKNIMFKKENCLSFLAVALIIFLIPSISFSSEFMGKYGVCYSLGVRSAYVAAALTGNEPGIGLPVVLTNAGRNSIIRNLLRCFRSYTCCC